MQKVLVTGGAGFIGRSVVEILKKNYKVTILDNFSFSNESQVIDDVNVSKINGDTRDWKLVCSLVEESDHIIHLAAPSSFLMHEENDLQACNFTMIGFKTIMEAMRKFDKRKIVWASTSAVYEEWDKEPRVPFREDMEISPPDSKAGCKHWCELEAERYSKRYGITSIAFRPYSVYGEGEHTKKGYANVTSLFTWALMGGNRPVVWGDGLQTRDFIYVTDVARAFVMAMESNLPTSVFNLGYGVEHTFKDVINIASKLLGVESSPIFVDIPIQIYAHRLWSDTTKIEKELRFKPEVTLEMGIGKIIQATNKLPKSVVSDLKLFDQQLYFEGLKLGVHY
jgi:nucleoside-diphosphate-sugar epimerase